MIDHPAPPLLEPRVEEVDIDESATLEDQIIQVLKGVYDPEIPVNIYDLGLIYRIDINEDKNVIVDMTLTAPGCPVAQTFPGTVECAVKSIPEVNDVHVELVWDPPWTQENMTEAALLQLGML
ncbi:MAG: SUF system Fe-S cluster assembly protein [Gammaproteobacteria bacterium]|nr:SUF system Fe-S cluster assembly protein [Gammaproteobacteria bacterium]